MGREIHSYKWNKHPIVLIDFSIYVSLQLFFFVYVISGIVLDDLLKVHWLY